MSGKNNCMAIKIDLEKAYDRISWDAIANVISELKIPPKMSKLIMNCISLLLITLYGMGTRLTRLSLLEVLDRVILCLPICLCCV